MVPLAICLLLMHCCLIASEHPDLYSSQYYKIPFNTLEQRLVARIQTVESDIVYQDLAALYIVYDRHDKLKSLIESKVSQETHSFYLFAKAYVHYLDGHYTQAQSNYELAYQLALEPGSVSLKQRKWVLTVALYKAINEAFLQRYTTSIRDLSELRESAASHEWPIMAAFADKLLGDVNYELKNYNAALEHYTRASAALPKATVVAQAVMNMHRAQMININGNTLQALSILDTSIETYLVYQHTTALADAYLLKSYFLTKQNKHKKALIWIENAVKLREMLAGKASLANAYTHFSGALLDNGDIARALYFGEQAVELANSRDDLALQWDANVIYAQSLYANGQYKLAYQFMSDGERALLKKARFDIVNEAARLNNDFNLKYEQLENQALKNENQVLETELLLQDQVKQRQDEMMILLILSLGALLSIVFVMYWLYIKNRRLATFDPLTKIYNRRRIFELGEREFAMSKRYDHALSVLMLDIDYFKQVNDTYGHDEGDYVLKFVAAFCQGQLRIGDYVGRIGGEEFLFLLPNTALEDSEKLAQRLCNELHAASINANLRVPNITVSIGAAQLDAQCNELSDLVNCADQALYCAKESGRNQIKVYAPHHVPKTAGSLARIS